jgi:hypothetical protein
MAFPPLSLLGGCEMSDPKQYLTLTLHDGSIYGIPVSVIARHRAESYAEEFNGDVERSLEEDTAPLFEESTYAIADWAANNMDWDDVKEHAVQLRGPRPIDFDEVWRRVPKEVQSLPAPLTARRAGDV